MFNAVDSIVARARPARVGLMALLVVGGCAPVEVPVAEAISSRSDVEAVLDSISGDAIEAHVRALASDEFEGRRPGTNGEETTLQYLEAQLEGMGLEPAGSTGFRQPFAIEAHDVRVTGRVGDIELVQGENVAAGPAGSARVTLAGAPIVFGGYGIVDTGRDDYADLELDGAAVVVLAGPPPDGRDYGDAASYSGKARAARARGARALLVVWDAATSSWDDTRSFYRMPFLRQFGAGSALPVLEIPEGLLGTLLSAAGTSLDTARSAAADEGFEGWPLGLTLDVAVATEATEVVSHNVLAAIPGSDPELAREWIVLTAHWDHLGADRGIAGDGVFNGALDNATGTATLLEIARTLAALPEAPRRSVLLLWTGAEEFGLLGARAYVADPVHPIAHTVAAINLDFQQPWGRTRDMIVIGPGNTTLEDDFAAVLAEDGRTVTPDPWAAEGYFQRSDHFAFAEAGVPALFPASGLDLESGGRMRGREMYEEYTSEDYHQPSDEVADDWDYAGLVQDARTFVRLTLLVADREERPRWLETTAHPALAARR